MTAHRFFRILRSGFASLPALAIVLASAPHLALADDDGTQAADPGVARVSVVEGSVDVKRGDSGDTVSADVNAPLSAGDYVSTQDDSHAEIEFDYGTELRIAPDSQMRFTQLEPNDHELQLAAGTLDLRLFHGADAHAQIETPQATITPTENGSTLVNVDNDGNTQVTVRSGRADVESAAGTQTLERGGTLVISGDEDHPQFQTVEPVSYASFDTWIANRDRYAERVSDNPYVANGMVGASDLYANGRWVDNQQYGQVWVPNVDAGWAPYHDGRWVWEPYYGWTWVDNEPWGWAPFHYGNWFYASDVGWAWYPGRYAVARPYVYRPALVAFFSFGGGGDGGIAIDFGNVGWVPLAPNEPFHAWWGNGNGYGYSRANRYNNTTIVNNYNNNTTIVNVYHNSNAPGGIVGVANGNFANGDFRHLRTLEPIDLRRAEPIRGVVPIVPTPQNLSFREHESAGRPFAPVARFENFGAPLRTQGPTFVQQQQNVKNAAVRNYPHHAEDITRIAPAGVSEKHLGEPAGPAYSSPDRGNVDAPRTPAYSKPGTPSSNDGPFNRFDRPSGNSPSSHPAPAYRGTPYYHTPSYRTYRSTGANSAGPHPSATRRPARQIEPGTDSPQHPN